MTDPRFVVTYDAIAADILDNGAGRPAALVLVSSNQQRVIIRMDRNAIARLKKSIERTFSRRYRGVAQLRPRRRSTTRQFLPSRAAIAVRVLL